MKKTYAKHPTTSSNRKKAYVIVLISLLIILIIAAVFLVIYAKKNIYKPFTWDGDKCVTYYKSCICIGLLRILESYPMQYDCQGWEICKNINETECE